MKLTFVGHGQTYSNIKDICDDNPFMIAWADSMQPCTPLMVLVLSVIVLCNLSMDDYSNMMSR